MIFGLRLLIAFGLEKRKKICGDFIEDVEEL